MWPEARTRLLCWITRSCLVVLVGCWALRVAAEDRGPSQRIDTEINAALAAKQLSPAQRADQAELLRRIYLDVLGRIPTRSEAEAYLKEPGDDKHHKLIDALLTHEEMPTYWAAVFDEWLCGSALERDFGRDAFLLYLEDNLRRSRPWNEIAGELIAPDVNVEQQRPAAYFLAIRLRGDNAEKLDNMTSAVATGLLGIQLQCAKCHDHPFVAEIRQDHYYGLASFFGRTQEARYKDFPLVREKAEGEVTFVTTRNEEKKAKLLFLDGVEIAEPERPADKNAWYVKSSDGLPEIPYFSRRAALARQALTAESPYFKRAMVNRLWKHLMGRGLVEPVDQMHAANPASHPALLNKLADDFASRQFDLRPLMSAILHSDAYLRSSRWTSASERPRDADYAVAILKPLTPAQLTTSVAVATGNFAQFQQRLEQEKAKRKLDAVTPGVARRLFARERDVQEFAQRFRGASDTFDAGASHALFLSYHPLVTKQLQPTSGNLVERLVKSANAASAADDAFLSVLARLPTDDERSQFKQLRADSKLLATQQYQEFVWALLCSAEFRFNH